MLFKGKKIFLTVSLSIALILTFSTTSVLAYNYWTNNYKMIDGITSGVFSNYCIDDYVFNGTTYNFRTACNGAINQWNSSTDMDIGYYQAGEVVKIHTRGTNFGDLDLYGWAEFFYDGNQVNGPYGSTGPTSDYDLAKSFINAYDIDESGLSHSEIRAVAIHEVGHCLGLAHERTSGVASVMNDQEYLNQGWLNPTSDDISGVNNLY